MAISPKSSNTKKEHLPFIDREEPIQKFKEALANIGTKEYSVLVYYGIAGIGKTRLRKELSKSIDAYMASNNNSRVVQAVVDFNIQSHRQSTEFLKNLSDQLQEKYGIKFFTFDIAYALYWKKVNPQIPLLSEDNSSGSIVNDLLDISSEVALGGLLLNIPKLVQMLPNMYREWALKSQYKISQLSSMEPYEIEKQLYSYWAYDLNEYLQKTSESAVIFIDSYEALWEKQRKLVDFNLKDKWLRDLIKNISGNCLWVICGREHLRWVELDNEWEDYLEQYLLGELTREDAIYFLESCGIFEDDIQSAIVTRSSGVPYYLELAVDSYSHIKKRRQPSSIDFFKIPHEIIDKFIKYLDPVEVRTLKVLSIPRFWDEKLFWLLVTSFNTGYPRYEFSDLCSFSFIYETEGNYHMHPLMRESLQEFYDLTDRKEIHKFLLTYYSKIIENIDIKAIDHKHENALIEAFHHAKETLEAEDLFNWFNDVSDPFYRAAFWQLIIPMYEEMLQILESKLGSEHPDVASTLNNLAGLYLKMGDYEKALPLYQRALEIRINMLGFEHPDVVTSLNNLAGLYNKMGDYEHALIVYEKALKISETVLSPQHPDVATILNDLAGLYNQIGDYEKALPLYQRAIEIKEIFMGPEHPEVGAAKDNLAKLYESKGEFKEALPLYQQALETLNKNLGPTHPSVASTLNNLSGLYNQMGDYGKALPLCQRALEIRENMLGSEHPDVANSLNNLALVYSHMGDYEHALPLYQKALELYERALGSQHPSVATTLNNLAELYRVRGDYEHALPLYQKALELYERALGSQHPSVATTLNNLAELYRVRGDYEHALPLYQRALELAENVLGSEHPDVANSLNNFAKLYESRGDYEKALTLYQQALKNREKALGKEHPDYVITLNNLAGLYEKMRGYEKALQTYYTALESSEKVFGNGHQQTAEILKKLGYLYSIRGESLKKSPPFLIEEEKITAIKSIELEKYRKYPKRKEFEFGRVNLFVGQNGSGKTSLLEAIELFMCGRTFRNPDQITDYKIKVSFEEKIILNI